MKIRLSTVGLALGGSILVWAAIRGQSVGDTVRALIGGKPPLAGQANPITPDTATDGGTTATPTVDVPSSSGGNKGIGKLLAAAYGWSTGAQWDALDKLWTRESGWNNHAKNPSSGAYGIPQALPQTKMPFLAQEKGGSSATVQIQWGLSYIANRYGNPVNAWKHETSSGWY